MSNPIAVLTSDIHFTPGTLEEASTSLSMAFEKALELKVPLVIAGDTLDTKAIIRAECANRLIEIFSRYQDKMFYLPYVLVGNHDLINEKGKAHSLNFLEPYCNLVSSPVYFDAIESYLIPYMSDPKELQAYLNTLPKGSRIIMHQGVQTAYLGHYVQDKTSLPQEAFADFRVISGHYHRAQDIKCGRPRKDAIGLFSYIGNPYSLNFGEASDGPKGFQVLYSNGLLEQVPTNLRKHVIIDWDVRNQPLGPTPYVQPGDLLWVKARGPASELAKINKKEIGSTLIGHGNFKLDLIPDDLNSLEVETKSLTDDEIMDVLIDRLPESEDYKSYLKALFREVLDETA